VVLRGRGGLGGLWGWRREEEKKKKRREAK